MIARSFLPGLLAMAACLVARVSAQDVTNQVPRIDHALSDGTWSPPPPPVPLPARQVLDETEYVLPAEGRSIIVQRVVPPESPEPVATPQVAPELTSEELAAARARMEEARDNHRKPVILSFSCTVYDHKVTMVRWMHDGQRFEAWSNLDWNDFSGTGSFVVGTDPTRHMIFLGLGNVDTISPRPAKAPKAPAVIIPEFPADGPGFIVTHGDGTNADALKPLEEMHALHKAEGTRLHEARLTREENNRAREAWLEANPPQPRDTVIQFGRKGPTP